jgi:hypothetical protein
MMTYIERSGLAHLNRFVIGTAGAVDLRITTLRRMGQEQLQGVTVSFTSMSHDGADGSQSRMTGVAAEFGSTKSSRQSWAVATARDNMMAMN